MTLVSVGTCSITANQAGNGTFPAATPVTQTFNVLQGTQTISNFTQPPDTPLTAGTVALTTTATSGLAVSFTSNSPLVCTVSGSTVTLVSIGVCSITANQLGNANFAAAPAVNTTFNVTAAGPAIPADSYQIRYASNLTQGDSVINISNSGANGASLTGPGFGKATGNLCVNAYTFSPDEQLISCCSCLLTPNALASLSVNSDLISNTLTGVKPNSVVVKLVATGAGADFSGATCTNSAALAGTTNFPLAAGLVAFGTTLHPPAVTETPFLRGTLSPQELASITNRCTNIVGNGSSFGICRSCRAGGLSSAK